MDGSAVTVDLLQRGVAVGVPDGDGSVFTARDQQRPGCIQAYSVHLDEHMRQLQLVLPPS